MTRTPTVSFVSLGCPKNLVDSERMLGLLAQDGYALVPDAQPADLVIINTCGFIDAARQESIGVIREMLDRKRAGADQGGDRRGLPGRAAEGELLEQVPEVDQVVGVFGREEIAQVADRIMGGLHEQRSLFRPAPVQAQDDRARLRITPRHLAYLKVSEGCDRLCTFCAIPFMRGKHVTKPIEMVVAEARRAGRRRRPRAEPRRAGHDLLRRRPLRPAPARRAAPRARRGRGDRLDPRPLQLSPVLHRRAVRRPGPRRRRSSRTWTCRSSTSTTGCSS